MKALPPLLFEGFEEEHIHPLKAQRPCCTDLVCEEIRLLQLVPESRQDTDPDRQALPGLVDGRIVQLPEERGQFPAVHLKHQLIDQLALNPHRPIGQIVVP